MRRGKELTLEITSCCTVGCKWCSSSSTPDGEHVPLEKLLESLRLFAPRCGVVRISGGEPLLHPQLQEVLYEAKMLLDYKVVLLTNGQVVLPESLCRLVDEVVVSLVNSVSFGAVLGYLATRRYCMVSMSVVGVEENDELVRDGVEFAFGYQLPIHVLALQRQGRGVDCAPSSLITWTGSVGCGAEKKVTVAWDGKVVSCSALKGKSACDIRG